MSNRRQCPHCWRWLLPVERSKFKVLCWPRHMLGAHGKPSTAATMARYQTARCRNETALADNELPCPLSGTPVDL